MSERVIGYIEDDQGNIVCAVSDVRGKPYVLHIEGLVGVVPRSSIPAIVKQRFDYEEKWSDAS